jgi:hypothetical protein
MSDVVQKITAAFERDQRRLADPLQPGELPLSYESLTDAWLTVALCKQVAGAQVTSHRLGEVDTGSSNRRKLALQYNTIGQSAGLPENLFCKASHDLANRMVLGISGGARCEVLFYRDVRPLLDIEAPHCYYAAYDAESCNSMIMLGDISSTVTEFCTDKTPIDRRRAESQMRLLGAMHGRVYGSPELQQRVLQLPTWPQFFENTKAFGMEAGSNRGFLAAESVIPSRLYARYAEIWPKTLASVELHQGLPHTLQHGDVHLKNWYVAGNGEMGLSDWQCCGRGHWARDVAYAVSSALLPEDRRAWERELLALYLDSLHAAGGPRVSFDQALLAFRQQLLTALTWWTITLTPAEGLPDMQPRDTTLEFLRRISTAMDDLESLDAF